MLIDILNQYLGELNESVAEDSHISLIADMEEVPVASSADSSTSTETSETCQQTTVTVRCSKVRRMNFLFVKFVLIYNCIFLGRNHENYICSWTQGANYRVVIWKWKLQLKHFVSNFTPFTISCAVLLIISSLKCSYYLK